MFLLVPAYPGCPEQTAVKWLLLLLYVVVVAGTTLSLYSQPFYTSRYGYKLCARVYLNGDGAGRGSYVSLFFVVMQVILDCSLLIINYGWH